jgi:hypothetical protein
MKKSENPAKLSKGCKQGLKNVSSSQNIQCEHVFFPKGHIKGQKKLVGCEGGVDGRLSQPMMAYY